MSLDFQVSPWHRGAVQRAMRRALPLVAVAFGCGSCGLFWHGNKQTVIVDSIPTNATVELDGQQIKTPAKLKLSRRHNHVVVAHNRNGAVVKRVFESESLGLWHFVDFLMFPFVFNIIDGMSGGASELVPEQLVIPLPPEDAGPEFQSVPAPSGR